MKKVGICACYGTQNYGSMLQAFATQIKVEQLGYSSEFIVYKKKKSLVFILKQIPRLLNKNLMFDKWMGIQKKLKMHSFPEVVEKEKIRKNAFNRFHEKYYKNFSSINYGYNELCNNASNYSTVLVGSDQLWTPGGLATNFYNLMFVPDTVNKVSYATSFGVSNIPWYQIRRTKKYLERINFLSVREIQGAKIIKEIAQRDAKVVADPTLLLGKDEWDKYIEHDRIVDEKYIFAYFLGTNLTHREIAKELSDKTGCKIVCTPFLDSFVKEDLDFGDMQLFDVSPADFVNLIRYADFVITDSFHGSVFSIIYQKKFVVLNRFSETSQSRNSRIESLCKVLGLESRRYNSDIVQEMLSEIDYEIVEQKLEAFRNESIVFLENSLK